MLARSVALGMRRCVGSKICISRVRNVMHGWNEDDESMIEHDILPAER